MVRIKYALLVAVLAVLLAAVPARADIVQTLTFGSFLPPQSPVLTFDQYDGSLGDLTGIIIEISITTTGGLAEVDNESGATSATVTFGTQGTLNYFSSTVTLPFELAFIATKATVSQTFSLGADDGDGTGIQSTGADYATLAGGTVTNSSSAAALSSVWSQYVGSGTYDIVVDISTYLNVSASGSVSQGSSPPSASGYVTVTYQGVTSGGGGGETPEPASLVLVCSSLGGLAVWRYRRKRKDGRDQPEA